MKNNFFIKTGIVVLSVVLACTTLFGCGKNNHSKKDATPTASAAAKNESEKQGETTTSKFSADKKEGSAKSTPEAHSAAANTTPNSGSGSSGSSANHENTPTAAIPSKVQSELDDAKAFATSGSYADAREMLDSIDKGGLTDEQLAQYESIDAQILSASENKESSFKPEDAVKIVENHYGITLQDDMSGLKLLTNSGGSEYYRIQFQLVSQNAIKTINVYKNGEIEEIASEPIAYG